MTSAHDPDAAEDGVEGRASRLLLTLSDEDHARVDPPADLWDRIAAEVAADAATEPSLTVEYWIDADDIVVGVGAGWQEFSDDNHGPSDEAAVSGRTLWSYFDSDVCREPWQLLVRRVRTLGSATTVPLRCDGPDARRWFDLAIVPEASDRVRFSCRLVFEEPRESVELLDPTRSRDTSATPVALCSWCGRAQHGDAWVDVEELARSARLMELDQMPALTYGICESCRHDMSSSLAAVGEAASP